MIRWNTSLLFVLLCFYYITCSQLPDNTKEILTEEKEAVEMTPMEALDQVKNIHASNFIKVEFTDKPGEYYYKLALADYYLIYEGLQEDGKYYLIHLYEFVLDDEDTGIGHTVTYGWYKVNRRTGEIVEE